SFALGVIAFLAHSRDARKMARGRPEFLALSEENDQAFGGMSFLTKMLLVLDDEPLLVLHPGERKGYRLKMSGVGTNFELFILLADAVIGDPREGWLPGAKPDPALVASCRDRPRSVAGNKTTVGAFNFFNWPALQTDRTLPEGQLQGSEHWIWMEGVP